MPAPQIAEEEKQAALQRADPSFLCKMSERNVPELYQALLAHAGFIDAQAFSRIHADEEKVRSDLESGLGINPDDGLAARALLANLVAVWAACRITVEVHDKAKASAEAASETWLIASHEHDDLRPQGFWPSFRYSIGIYSTSCQEPLASSLVYMCTVLWYSRWLRPVISKHSSVECDMWVTS